MQRNFSRAGLSVLGVLALSLGWSRPAAAAYIFNSNFAALSNGDLAGQDGWSPTGASPVVSRTPLSGTNFLPYIQSPGGSGPAEVTKSMGGTVSSGFLYTTVYERLQAGNSDGVELYFTDGSNLISAFLDNRFNSGFLVVLDRGGAGPEDFFNIGSDAALLNHWFQLDLSVNFDLHTESLHVTDLNGSINQTFGDTIGSSFAPNTVGIFTENSGVLAVPEPGSIGVIACVLVPLALRRRRRAIAISPLEL